MNRSSDITILIVGSSRNQLSNLFASIVSEGHDRSQVFAMPVVVLHNLAFMLSSKSFYIMA